MTLMELLMAMSIAAVVSGMIIMGWISLQNSYSYSVSSNKAREYARDGMSRMVREIRDAKGRSTTYPVSSTAPDQMSFYSVFNDVAAASDKATDVQSLVSYAAPLVTYRYDAASETLYRKVGTGAERPLVQHVVNAKIAEGSDPTTPVFTYTYVNSSGTVVQATAVPTSYLGQIRSVRVHLLVDLNPEHSPVYMDLVSTAELRNALK